MAASPDYFQRLGITLEEADTRTVRKAYARELKLIDPGLDPEGFQALRNAYESALRHSQFLEETRLSDVASNDATTAAPPVVEVEQPQEPSGAIEELANIQPPIRDDSSIKANAPAPDVTGSPIPEATPEQLARAVYSEFTNRILLWARPSGIESLGTERQCRQVLESTLADPRLDNLEARDIFEWLVAERLAYGWQPGHETLFAVAMETWDGKKTGDA